MTARGFESRKKATFPFGGGQRICGGHILAMLLMKMVVAMTARAFRLEPVEGQDAVPMPLTTLRPRRGIWMRMRDAK